LKRTNVYADEDDLALIKAAAERTGRSESEIIREAIHRAAWGLRAWDEPVVTQAFHFGGRERYDTQSVRDAVAEGSESATDR
jgi:hypothetical protein